VAAERTGWRAAWPRRVGRFLGGAEERTAASGAARIADAAIAAVATIAAVLAVIIQIRRSGGPDILFVQPGAPPIRLGSGHAPFPPARTLLGAALTTAPLAFRRVYPITAFCVILAAVIGTRNNTTSITFAAAIFAAYSAVAYSRFRQLALLSVLAGAFVVTAAYPNTTPPVPERYTALLVLLPTVAVGVAIRVWRGRARDSDERLRRAEAEHEAETRRAVEVERARIASEMHDVVTHNVSVMVVQAGAARRVLDSMPGDAREALLAVEASGRTAMTELRHLLGLLAPAGEGIGDPPVAGAVTVAGFGGVPGPGRGGVSSVSGPGLGGAVGSGPGGASGPGLGGASGPGLPGPGLAGAAGAALSPQPGVTQIPALLARVVAAGLPVELSVDAPQNRRSLPPGLDLAAYRVVQEALTNVMKHAGQARTTVRIEFRTRELLITVSDDGRPADAAPGPGQPAAPGGGRGLIGLRERLAVYGGVLDAGPRPGGGWRLAVRVPLEPVIGDGEPGLPGPPQFRAASL
jgi:signal transduction histidine kinase